MENRISFNSELQSIPEESKFMLANYLRSLADIVEKSNHPIMEGSVVINNHCLPIPAGSKIVHTPTGRRTVTLDMSVNFNTNEWKDQEVINA